MDIEVGTIVLLPFPFTDLSSAKVRPTLVISDVNEENIIVAFISSKLPANVRSTDFIISKSQSYFAALGLKKGSVIKCEKIMTLSKSILLGEIGKLPQDVFQKEIKSRLKIAMKLD